MKRTAMSKKIIVLIGPMGCGKTTVGRALGQRLKCKYYDADDYHPQANIEKMRQGIPLTDEDREFWLVRLRKIVDVHLTQGSAMVLGCSALKRLYRQKLGIDEQTVFSVYLKADKALLLKRLGLRQHDYMPIELLDSQLETWESPSKGLSVDASASIDCIINQIVDRII